MTRQQNSLARLSATETSRKWQDEALTLFSGDGDPNEYLLENYEYYLNEWINEEPVLRKITSDAAAAGDLKSEDEIRMFIIAFRSMAKTLAVLKRSPNLTGKTWPL